MKDRIFVSIAAYRDPELARTVRDLFALAARPAALTVAILDQSDAPLPRSAFPRPGKIVLDRCRAAESHGACWARARLQQRLGSEDFYLQFDAHHVFKPRWDEVLLEQLAACPSPRPVLTGYLPPYEIVRGRPRVAYLSSTPMQFAHFDRDGVVIYRSYCHETERPQPPQPSRFFSGHFAFARRELVERVPYDAELYFYGEESSMAARAFTHGFDLFHPGRTVAWHHYTRKGRPRHWEDHDGTAEKGTPWTAEQVRSVAKYRDIFGASPRVWPRDGLGTVRTLAEYEAWAGVNHHWQLVHRRTKKLFLPPPSSTFTDWPVRARMLAESTIKLPLPPLASVDARPCKFVYVAIGTARHAVLEWNVSPQKYAALRRRGCTVTVQHRRAPLALIVWPYIRRRGWGESYASPKPLTCRPSRRTASKKSPRRALPRRDRPPQKKGA